MYTVRNLSRCPRVLEQTQLRNIRIQRRSEPGRGQISYRELSLRVTRLHCARPPVRSPKSGSGSPSVSDSIQEIHGSSEPVPSDHGRNSASLAIEDQLPSELYSFDDEFQGVHGERSSSLSFEERALFCKVVLRAFQDARGRRLSGAETTSEVSASRRQQEARDWFEERSGEDLGWGFVAESLGFDPDTIIRIENAALGILKVIE